MRVQQSLTLQLEGDDVAALRALLRRLPADVVSPNGMSGLAVPFLVGETCVDPQDLARFAQRLARAVQGVS